MQVSRPAGVRLQALANFLDAGGDPLILQADPAGLAPERLLVFELTGTVQNFAKAVARVDGLHLALEDVLEPDAQDQDPCLYVVVPNAVALKQLISLWKRFRDASEFPRGLTPWREVFAQLRDLRPWGPQDRLGGSDLEVLSEALPDADGNFRIEIELVFATQPGAAVLLREKIDAAGGRIVSECRIEPAQYHAMLVEVPQAERDRMIELGAEGLIAAPEVLYIRPQSLVHHTPFEGDELEIAVGEAPALDPIVSVFDAVPLAGHPLLAGRLSIEDPFQLEPLAVGDRRHGTAMASAVAHGDLSLPWSPLSRRIHFVNVMFAPALSGEQERFPDKLPADVFHTALSLMKDGAQPTAPHVIVVNASLGDKNKPFFGRPSGWARVLDYLGYRYGVLFIVSAGNHLADLDTPNMGVVAFGAHTPAQQAEVALRAVAQQQADRRILSPAEAMNALTVGSLHDDRAFPAPPVADVYDIWAGTGLCNVSSGLGPGFANSTKPDVLAKGGRHHVRLVPKGLGHGLRPLGANAGALAGIAVAAPPIAGAVKLDATARTIGTSVAAALTTGLAARIHEALEAAYPDFGALPNRQRAALLKALLVHSAKWTGAEALIGSVFGPQGSHKAAARKDNVRRLLGFGAIDEGLAISCIDDRATLWAVGQLGKESSHTYSVPLPVAMSGKALPHAIWATLAWFAPPRIGSLSYRGARLKLLEPAEAAQVFAVKACQTQPDQNQTHRGTVVHRRWEGSKAVALGASDTFDLVVQREPDASDDIIDYGFAVSLSMSGVSEVYAEVRERIEIKPLAPVPVAI